MDYKSINFNSLAFASTIRLNQVLCQALFPVNCPVLSEKFSLFVKYFQFQTENISDFKMWLAKKIDTSYWVGVSPTEKRMPVNAMGIAG